MCNNKNNESSNFKEADNFLQNILELRKIVSYLMKHQDEVEAYLPKLNEIVDYLVREIKQSGNK